MPFRELQYLPTYATYLDLPIGTFPPGLLITIPRGEKFFSTLVNCPKSPLHMQFKRFDFIGLIITVMNFCIASYSPFCMYRFIFF